MRSLLNFVLPLLYFSCQGHKQQSINYPPIKSVGESITQFDTTVVDPFSNLSKLSDVTIKKWYVLQDSLAEDYFKNEPSFHELLEQFKELEGNQGRNLRLITISENGRYFYIKTDGNSNSDILCFRKSLNDQEITLFKSSDFEEGKSEITYLSPSYDGNLVVVGFNSGESFAIRMIIIDVKSKKILPDKIRNINPEFGGIEWLPDNSGFTYLYFPNVESSSENFKKDSFSRLHFIGKDFESDIPVFQNSISTDSAHTTYPKLSIASSKSKFVIGYLANAENFYNSYIISVEDLIEGTPSWKPFFTKADSVFWDQGVIKDQYFVYRKATSDGNTLNRVAVSEPNFKSPEILARGSSDNPILDFTVNQNAIYYTRSKFGVEGQLFKIENNGKHLEIKLPYHPGHIEFLSSSQESSKITIGLDSWTTDYQRFIIDADGRIIEEGLNFSNDFPQFENIQSSLLQIKGYDGALIPLSLIYQGDIKSLKSRPVFMYVYGAYGDIMSPFYSPIFLDWVAKGGILAFPHVRGGGEKGEKWHEMGMKLLKHNSWQDLNSCSEYLIDKGFASPNGIALYTSSAGGITAGMAVNKKPDLYGAFIAEVPRMNPYSLESSEFSTSSSFAEYGTVKDSLEYYGLLRMDPYLNLKQYQSYPSTLMIPSSTDDRIPLWDTGKYIARLQLYNGDSSPKLLDINYDSGHDANGSYEDYLRTYAKIFAFARKFTGKE